MLNFRNKSKYRESKGQISQVWNELQDFITYTPISHYRWGLSTKADTFVLECSELPVRDLILTISFESDRVSVELALNTEKSFIREIKSEDSDFCNYYTLAFGIYVRIRELYLFMRDYIQTKEFKESHGLTRKQVKEITDHINDVVRADYKVNVKTTTCYKIDDAMRMAGFKEVYYTRHPYEGDGNEYMQFVKDVDGNLSIHLDLRIGYKDNIYLRNIYLTAKGNPYPFRYFGPRGMNFEVYFCDTHSFYEKLHNIIRSGIEELVRKLFKVLTKRYPEYVKLVSYGGNMGLLDLVPSDADRPEALKVLRELTDRLFSIREGIAEICASYYKRLDGKAEHDYIAQMMWRVLEDRFYIMDRPDRIANNLYTFYIDKWNWGIYLDLFIQTDNSTLMRFDVMCPTDKGDRTFKGMFVIEGLKTVPFFGWITVYRSVIGRVVEMLDVYLSMTHSEITESDMDTVLDCFRSRFKVDIKGMENASVSFTRCEGDKSSALKVEYRPLLKFLGVE